MVVHFTKDWPFIVHNPRDLRILKPEGTMALRTLTILSLDLRYRSTTIFRESRINLVLWRAGPTDDMWHRGKEHGFDMTTHLTALLSYFSLWVMTGRHKGPDWWVLSVHTGWVRKTNWWISRILLGGDPWHGGSRSVETLLYFRIRGSTLYYTFYS